MKAPLLTLLALAGTLCVNSAAAAGAAKPNIVLFVADDLNRYDVGCYGAVNTKTPNIDALAKAGMKFNSAYCAAAQCSPCRAELYTGRFPVNNGLIGNGISCKLDLKCVTQYLGALGYRTGQVGKYHVGPNSLFTWEKLNKLDSTAQNQPAAMPKKGKDEEEGPDVEDYRGAIREYMGRKRDQPFFLATCSHQPHKPWTKGNAAAFDVKKLVVPANLFDCPETREELTHYYAEVEYLDWQVGQVMKIVQDLGLTDQTLFMFVTEQGAQLPGGKYTTNEAGIHAGMVVRWPGRIRPGSTSDAIVHYADVLPTLVAAAGGTISDPIDGRSFLGVLEGLQQKFRDYSYGFTTSALPASTPGGYAIRAITDGRFKLIVNYSPEKVFKSPAMGGAYKTWRTQAATDAQARAFVRHYENHPRVELYDLQKDPWEMTNVADNPENQRILATLTSRLQDWLTAQHDEPLKTEVQALGGRNAKRARARKDSMKTQ